MQLGLLTTSYKTAAIEIREQLAINDAEVDSLIAFIKSQTAVQEVVVLSTCNRVEIYYAAKNPIKVASEVQKALYRFLELPESFDYDFERLMGRDAIRHIFRVTASLEAMVIGEPQITGQVKDFFHLSAKAGGPGFFLNQILNRSFSTAKRVKTETAIAKFAVSISFAAVELAKKIFTELSDKSVLIIGAGEMAELALTHLLKAGCSHLLVTNRTFSRAVALAERFNGNAVRFEQMDKHLATADIILSSTGAKGFILNQAMIQQAMKARKHRSMFLIDIAVPRDIDPEINEVSNAYVYDIDDLQSVVDANLLERQKEAEHAQVIIEEELNKVDSWLSTLDVVPTIKALREKVLATAQSELDKHLAQMGEMTHKQERTMRAMINGFAYKVLHQPTLAVKQRAKDGEASMEYIQILSELFDLAPVKEQAKPTKILPLK